MSLSDYQKRIDKQVQAYKKPYWDPLSNLARLAEETGEVARILNHKFGDKPKKDSEEHDHLGDELADVIYTCICIGNSQDIDMDVHMENALAKLETRDKDRFEKKKD